LLSGPDSRSMHEDLAQEAVAQMPEISCPDALEMGAIDQLAKDGIDPVPPLGDAEAAVWPRILGAWQGFVPGTAMGGPICSKT
jgi:hypothetical protein